MRQSELFTTTLRQAPADADSINAKLLTQGAFIDQLMAGVYTYLPLGLRVLANIETIVREEMNTIGGQELLMPALNPKEPWIATGRWNEPGKDVMFQFKGRGDKDIGLGWSHEEIITPLAKQYIHSYRDLPFAAYQIQDKFRNEPRAKSGLLRGREFLMKDMYSFHTSQEDLDAFYEKATQAYFNVFLRCGLQTYLTEALGGPFSKYSHEFQVLAENGEDTIFYCSNCNYAQNKELDDLKAGSKCPKCGGAIKEGKAIEVGNIFRLGTRYTDAFDVQFSDEKGMLQKVIMGCFGIGIGRVMGAIVEVHHDDKGIQWPASVAPFHVHLLRLGDDANVQQSADTWYDLLTKEGYEVFYDDTDRSTGEKLNDADLVGMPVRLVVSARTEKETKVEVKARTEEKAAQFDKKKALEYLRKLLRPSSS